MKAHLCEDGTLMYECPACKHYHAVSTTKPLNNGAGPWGFNGDLEKPTITPSVNVLPYTNTKGEKLINRCHHFVRDGKIQFLADCEHSMAGTTVDLPEWEP